MMKDIREIMTKDIAILPKEANIFDVVDVMKNHSISCIIIMRDDVPEGIITESDILKKVILADKDPKETTVEEVMTSPVLVVTPEMQFTQVARLMKEKKIRRFPVVENNILYGLVTQTDISNATIDYLNELNAKLKGPDISIEEFHKISEEFYDLQGHEKERPDIKHMAMEIMSSELETIKEQNSVYEAAERILKTPTNCVVVVDDNDAPLGIITERDLVAKVLAKKLNLKDIKVEGVMTHPLITVKPEEKIPNVGMLMKRHNIRRMVVVAEGELVGIVTHSSIVHNARDMALAIHSDILDKWQMG